jgi:hypothetical protein
MSPSVPVPSSWRVIVSSVRASNPGRYTFTTTAVLGSHRLVVRECVLFLARRVPAWVEGPSRFRHGQGWFPIVELPEDVAAAALGQALQAVRQLQS